MSDDSSPEPQTPQAEPKITTTYVDAPAEVPTITTGVDAPAEVPTITTGAPPSSALPAKSKSNRGPIIGLTLAAILLLALCGVGAYEFAHRMLPKLIASAPQPAPQSQTPPEAQSKPSPSEPSNSNLSTPQNPPAPSPTPEPAPAATPATTPAPAPAPAPTPAPKPTKPTMSTRTSTQPAKPSAPISPEPRQAYSGPVPRVVQTPPGKAKSGTLHYQGQPVPSGGVVTFENLPKGHLKYTFDRSSWRLTLTNNPDGTRKAVQLTSIRPGFQTNCDLSWEIVP